MSMATATTLGSIFILLTLQPGGRDPAFSDPLSLARHAVSLAQQALDLGPRDEEGQRYASEAAQWCVYAYAAALYQQADTDEVRAALREAVDTCARAAPGKVQVQPLKTCRQSNQHLCAIAVLRMLLSHWGIDAGEDELIRLAGESARTEGVHVSFALECLPRYGISAFSCQGDEKLLRVSLAAGFPVAVYQWVRRDRDVRHMRLVVGYETPEEGGEPEWLMVDPAPEMPLNWRADSEELKALWECAWDEDGHTRWMCVPYAQVKKD